jgi:hypothetical protein
MLFVLMRRLLPLDSRLDWLGKQPRDDCFCCQANREAGGYVAWIMGRARDLHQSCRAGGTVCADPMLRVRSRERSRHGGSAAAMPGWEAGFFLGRIAAEPRLLHPAAFLGARSTPIDLVLDERLDRSRQLVREQHSHTGPGKAGVATKKPDSDGASAKNSQLWLIGERR